MHFLSIKAKLVLALSVILLAAFVATSVVNYRVSRDAVREELLSTGLPLTRDTIHSELRAELMRPLFVASLMSTDTFLRDWALDGEHEEEAVRRYLEEIRARYGFLTAFFVSDATRSYYYYGGRLKTISRMDLRDVWYYEFAGRGQDFDLNVDANQAAGGVLSLFINHRVEDYRGYLLGVAGVGLDLEEFSRIIAGFQNKYHRRIVLVDEFGTVQLGPDPTRVGRDNIRTTPGISSVAREVLALRGEPANFEYSGPGGTVLLAARHLDDIGWTLLVEQDEASALAAARGNLVRTLAVGVFAWAVILALSVATVNHFQRRLVHMAATDQLTGAANRWEFESRFGQAESRFARHGTPFALILFDLDHFKAVNDCLGHLEGDRVLRGVAELIRESIRPCDLLSRWGGDEFMVLAEGGEAEAVAVAERIREAVAVAGFAGGQGCEAVTVSCGVAGYRCGESLDGLTRRVDQAAYAAKARGRNRVAVSPG